MSTNAMVALRVLSDEHRNFWRVITALEHVSAQMAQNGGDDASEGSNFMAAAFRYLDEFADALHHPKEDDYLFARMRERSTASHALLDRLEDDHRKAKLHMEELQRLLVDPSPQGRQALFASISAYVAQLKNHIRMEETEAFPLASQILTEADWVEIDACFSNHADPAFGDSVQEHFRDFYGRVVNLAPDPVGLGGGVKADPPVQMPSPAAKSSPSGSGEVILSVNHLQSAYGKILALKGVSLEVRRGEMVALVGANGAGKTTFLRTLSGVQPQCAGSIYFEGQDISTLRSDLRMRKGICQSPEGRQVFGPLSTEDNLRLGAYTQPKAQVAEDMEKVFAMFPVLKEKRALAAGTLSGGQQQMLAIGRALMGRPKLLLLDEPSMGLAPLLVEEVFNVVRRLRDQGMTILLVEQNAFAALALADRGYVMEAGEIRMSGTGQELLHNEEVRSAYLGM